MSNLAAYLSRSVLVLLAAALLCGCADEGPNMANPDVANAVKRVHDLDRLDLANYSLPATAPASGPAGATMPGRTGAAAPASAPAAVCLTLAECRAASLKNNLDLEVELYNPSIAAQEVRREKAKFESVFTTDFAFAKLDPTGLNQVFDSQSQTFQLTPGWTLPLQTGGTFHVGVPLNRASYAFEEPNPQYGGGLEATISQPLLRGAGIATNNISIRIAQLQEDITQSNTKLEVIRVLAAVDRAYWRLYAARQELAVREQELALAKAQLERARRQVKAQVAAEVEVVRAESGVADKAEVIIVAANQVRERQRELKRIINMPGLDIQTRIEVIPCTQPGTMELRVSGDELCKLATANRMEMLQLELQIAQDVLNIDLAKNQSLPLLTVDYTYRINAVGGTPGSAWDMGFDGRFQDHLANVRLEIPVGNEAAKAHLRAAVLTRLQRMATPKARAQQIRQEVLDAIDSLDAAWQRVEAGRKRTVLAKRVLAAEQRQFDLGLRTSTDVLDAQTRYADAELSQVQAVTEYQIAQVDIAFATGTILGEAKVEWTAAMPSHKELHRQEDLWHPTPPAN